MKQKVGLIVDSLQVSKQFKDFIDMSLTANNYEITTIIVNDAKILSSGPEKKYLNIFEKGFLEILE